MQVKYERITNINIEIPQVPLFYEYSLQWTEAFLYFLITFTSYYLLFHHRLTVSYISLLNKSFHLDHMEGVLSIQAWGKYPTTLPCISYHLRKIWKQIVTVIVIIIIFIFSGKLIWSDHEMISIDFSMLDFLCHWMCYYLCHKCFVPAAQVISVFELATH